MLSVLRSSLAFVLLLLVVGISVPVYAAGENTHQLVLVPHCTEVDRMKCPSFSVLDGTRLTTPRLQKGDILDIDIEIRTSSLSDIHTVRSWVQYDPRALSARSLELSSLLSAPFPSEQEIDAGKGLFKIGGDLAQSSPLQTGNRFVVARMTLSVLDPSIASTLSFFEFSPIGHGKTSLQGVTVLTGDGVQDDRSTLLALPPCIDSLLGCDDAEHASLRTQLLRTAPASLVVDTGASSASSILHSASLLSSTSSAPRMDDVALAPPLPAAQIAEQGSPSAQNDVLALVPPSTNAASVPLTPPLSRPNDTFPLLQIQNVRVTTEGSSLLLAWQPLGSSALKGYNVYYGTVSGQYIQRRSIPMTPPSLTLRDLEPGVTYYVSVRGFAEGDVETSFSEEASVTIGKPETASSPLLRTSLLETAPNNPLVIREQTSISGDTGPATWIASFLLLSSVVGACLAWHRSSPLL